MKCNITIWVMRGEEELELEVSGTVSPYVSAVTHLAPENCHPAEGGEVEIETITLHGEKWNGELTDEELDRAEDGLFEAAYYDDSYFEDLYEDDDLNYEEIINVR